MPTRSRLKDLYSWDEIADDGWRTLLLGNGMSINVDERFAYHSLFEKAVHNGVVEDVDRRIFAAFDTRNFEVVLAKLRDAIALAEAMERSPDPFRERFIGVQAALGKTLGLVHPQPREISKQALASIQEALLAYDAVFTTSYDLLAYWAIGQNGGFNRFGDCFRPQRYGGHCVFDPADPGEQDRVPIYYLHGALHLLVSGSGVTRKLTTKDPGGGGQLLSRFDKPIEDDPDARPLLVSEGSADDKLLKIESNDYLAYVHEKLRQRNDPLVVFGQSLRDQDAHLIEAITSHPRRRVAVSLHDDGAGSAQRERRRISEALEAIEGSVTFFDSATHPLGRVSVGRQPERPRPRRRRRRAPWARRG